MRHTVEKMHPRLSPPYLHIAVTGLFASGPPDVPTQSIEGERPIMWWIVGLATILAGAVGYAIGYAKAKQKFDFGFGHGNVDEDGPPHSSGARRRTDQAANNRSAENWARMLDEWPF